MRLSGLLAILITVLVVTSVHSETTTTAGAVQVKETDTDKNGEENADVRTRARYLEKLTEEGIYQKIMQKQRMIVYFTKEEPTEEQKQFLMKYQNDINSKVSDITVGYHVCEDNKDFGCSDPQSHFPRLKFMDFKKELELNLTTSNFEESFTKIKNYAVPRILLIKTEAYLKELLEVTTHNLIGFFDKNDTKSLESLKKLAKSRKKSPLFIEVSMVDLSIIDSPFVKETFKEGPGLYLWINDNNGPKRLTKYAYDYDDAESLITYIEVESLPLVMKYKKELFSQVFAGVLKAQVILFVDKFENAQKQLEELEKASKYNKEHDLYYHRMIFMAYQIGTDPEIENAFGKISPGDVFISVVLSQEFARFKFNGSEVTNSSLVQFIDDFRSKKVEPFYPSEDPATLPPYMPGTTISLLTATDFKEKVVQQQMNYLVLFCNYKEDCQYAINLIKFVEKFNPNPDILQFAFMNSDKNEVKGLKIGKYPTLALFSVGQKNKPRGYELDLQPNQLMGWLGTYVPGIKFNEVDDLNFFAYYFSNLSHEQKLKMRRDVIDRGLNVKGIDREWLVNLIQDWEESTLSPEDREMVRQSSQKTEETPGPEDL